MEKLSASDKIYVAQSGISGAGRGVFAKCDIRKGELIERCPVIEIPSDDFANLSETILTSYFYHGENKKNQSLIALGFGSIYNHSYKPNAIYKIKQKEKVMDFIALSDIKKDEEISVNYNPRGLKNKNSLWFE